MDKFYEKLLSKKDRNFIINKSILALNNLNNKKRVNELRPNLIFKKIKNKLVVHNYFLEKIEKKIYLNCLV